MTAALAKPDPKSPVPADVDEAAEFFQDLLKDLEYARKSVKEAQALVDQYALHLIEHVRNFGGPHATKSKILHGIVWEMVATFAQYTSQDSAAIERFRVALVEAGQTRLMKKIFSADVRYTLKASADEIVKTGKLSKTQMELLLLCSTTQDKKPSLDVRQKKKAS